MRVLIKVGGTLLDDAASRTSIARQLAEVAQRCELVVVHGGGKQVTRFLEERGVQSRFINGLRVSDEVVIDAVVKVIAGSVNKQLVSALVAAGELAVGLSGLDGSLTKATHLSPELEFVGRPMESDTRLLDLLINSGYLPVVACIAGDEHGHVYNVNGDQMAVSCAVGWRAEKLIFLTDVEGVKDNHGQIIVQLTPYQIHELIVSGVARGGMRAKLDAANAALSSGLEEVVIASGHQPLVCQRLLAGEALGTRLSAQPVAMEGASR